MTTMRKALALVAVVAAGTLGLLIAAPGAGAVVTDGPSQIDFTKALCKSYSNIIGNEKPNEPDDTNGGSAFYAPGEVTDVTAPGPIYDGCEPTSDWSFRIGSRSDVEGGGGRVVTKADGAATATGFTATLTSEESALAAGDGLWVTENNQDGYLFGAIRCADDSLHSDNLEVIRNFHFETAYCSAYNVIKGDTDVPVNGNPLAWLLTVAGIGAVAAGGIFASRRKHAA
jgi:hypothetical protein